MVSGFRCQVSIFGFVSDFDIRILDLLRRLSRAINSVEVFLLNIYGLQALM